MKIKKITTTLLLVTILYSCVKLKKEDQSSLVENGIEKTWENFLTIVQEKDKAAFKEVSSKTIRCYLCLENTLADQKELDAKRESDPDWYNQLYDKDIYIPIDRFINEDFDLIFNPEFVSILKEKKTIFYKNDNEEVELYEVLVTTTEPSAEHEGGQHSFQFIKKKGDWKLREIGTIP
ncbi:hypothetical protein [Aquimarina algiphila]|uniref:hypothetical protein n=1 Tax=Aquimarina algiphila TaxID=2047982 RepID=UPI00232DFED1|nr:hypothetical protein [Aquimarina algiphila]